MSTTITERFRMAVTAAGGARDAATKAGVSPGTVHDFLTFPAAVTVSRLLQMARACGVRPEWLLTGQEPMRPGGPVALSPTEGCSFCGAAPHAVLHMVAGERARICDGCVDLASTSCAQHRAPLARVPGAPLPILSMEPRP